MSGGLYQGECLPCYASQSDSPYSLLHPTKSRYPSSNLPLLYPPKEVNRHSAQESTEAKSDQVGVRTSRVAGPTMFFRPHLEAGAECLATHSSAYLELPGSQGVI